MLALARPSVIGLWHDLGSITTPMLLLPVGTALLQRGRLGARWTVVAMLVPFAVALGWVLARTTGSDGVARYPWSIEPIYCGLASSLLLYGAGWAVHSSRRRATLAAAPLEGERIS